MERLIALFAPIGLSRGSASLGNVRLLVQLRWTAVIGQLVTIIVAQQWLGVRLPLAPLLLAPLLLIVVNLVSASVILRRHMFSQAEMFFALMIDVVTLGWQLYHSGGTTNPFTFLFLLQIVIAAVILDLRWSSLVAINACLCVLLLTFFYVPLQLPTDQVRDPFRLYIYGSLLCFVLAAVLLIVFVARLDLTRRASDAKVASLRQQALEEDHIIRMGLLASGAAHELGTPLSSISVILGDWSHQPGIADDPDLAADMAEIQRELARCKTIVSGILMSAGEMRGEAPAVTTLRGFLGEIVEEWRPRMSGELRFVDRIDVDRTIVSDVALRQVIGNVIDNAVEVSPDFVVLEAWVNADRLVLSISDHGPGFAPEILRRAGQPYASTKGRDGGGLGLFLVFNVIRKLGGTVSVENLPDRGARVQLSIPLATLAYEP